MFWKNTGPEPVQKWTATRTGGRGDWTQDYVPDPSGWIPDLTPARGVKNLTSKGRPDGTGTPEDPIDVRGDVGRALALMHDGKNVRLNQVREVATLLRKVQGIAKESAAEGRNEDGYGTLGEAHSLAITRSMNVGFCTTSAR